ncbi:MAG: hypothetical protein NXI24_23435 [bacterium]|nr:hypothetical protein [bacterium]
MSESVRQSPEQEEAVRRDFRKGNINFDFLQPEGSGVGRRSSARGPDRRSGEREGKRGLFNRGRPPRPVGWLHVSAWSALLVGSAAATIWIIVLGDSVLWLLLLPFALSTGLWSVIMLALFQSRPR